jgi:ABC-2 type transport system ATP-binding protein
MNNLAIQTWDLRKTYGQKVAVRDLTLEVRQGEVFGFLGPNGAGKTTSIKMLLGLVKPTGGRATILGQPITDVEIRRRIGFLPEHFRFQDWLTAEELLRLHGRLYGMTAAELRQRIPALLELVGLLPHRNQHLNEFSKGMLQRIGLAQALLNDPGLIFLDEPTSGLDPVGRRLVRDIIRNQRLRGVTVFLSSHQLGEVEVTCDRVSFIKHGELLAVKELQSLMPGELTVLLRARNLSAEVITGLERWARVAGIDGEQLTLRVAGDNLLPEVSRYLAANGVDVYAFTPQQPSLEDLFIQIVGTDGGL